MEAAVYDMDKTITRRPSWMSWLIFFAMKARPWRLLLLPFLIIPFGFYLFGFLDRRVLKEWMQCLLMGRRVDAETVARVAESFARHFGKRAERQDALRQIEADRAAGRRLVMATASSAYYAEALGARWGFDEVIGTRNVWQGNMITHRIAGENCYDINKLEMVVTRLGERPSKVIFYTDHVSDMPCLMWADEPVIISPSSALEQEGKTRDWPIFWWK